MKLLRLLRLVFQPFKSIAKSLEILVQLYELDLASRTPPIIRVTEKPNPKVDTEVVGYPEDKDSLISHWWRQVEEEEEDEAR